MSNKKSQVEDWLPLLFIIVALVIVILFISLSNVNRNKSLKEGIELQILEKDSNQLLLDYLDVPIAFENFGNANVADAINNYFVTEDKGILNNINLATKDFFSKTHLESDYSSWSILITKQRGREIIIESDKSSKQHIIRREVSKVFMPTLGNKDFVEVRLFYVQTKFVAE